MTVAIPSPIAGGLPYYKMRNFIHDDILNADADLIVIPCSNEFTFSDSFFPGIKEFGVTVLPPRNWSLGDIIIKRTTAKNRVKYFAFAGTVEDDHSYYGAIRRIGRELGRQARSLRNVKVVASPILGTGAGGLNYVQSLNVLVKAFHETSGLNLSLDIYTNDSRVHSVLDKASLNLDKPSAVLAFEAEIGLVLEQKTINQIFNSKELYYQLAVDKFHEFLDYRATSPQFYDKIISKFKKTGKPFSNFLDTKMPEKEREILAICGQLIAYIDFNAYLKQIWNRYPDKRVLARTGVRQTHWITSLLRFKKRGDIINDWEAIHAKSIRNAILYLTDPKSTIPVLSERHRQLIFSSFLPNKYTGEKSMYALFAFFDSLGIHCKNRKNDSVLYCRILYTPAIRAIWMEDGRMDKNDQITDFSTASEDREYARQLILENLNTKSKTLDLGNCGLLELGELPELFRCTHLEELILSNEWAEFEGDKWRKRRSNNKGRENCLTELPENIAILKNLKRLICGGDWNTRHKEWNRWQIRGLGAITSLRKLEYLNLSNNLLLDLSGLTNLRQLRVLHLNNNRIQKIPSLGNLRKLKELYLSNNRINNVRFLKALKTIGTIDLHANDISDIQPLQPIIEQIGISNSKWETGTLNIAKNPLETPPMEIIIQGPPAVLRYFQDINDGFYINKDIKVILIGNSEVGKTTIAKYMDSEKDLGVQHSATHWMEERVIRSKYKVDSIAEECTLRLFDFGGHDYFHDTHHLFFTSNTVYLLMWDQKTNKLAIRQSIQDIGGNQNVAIQTQDYPIRYWLDSVKNYIKDVGATNFEFEIDKKESYNSKLLLVQTKVTKASEIQQLNNEKIFNEYSFIHESLNISLPLPRRNMEQFDFSFTELLNDIALVGAKLPKYFEPIKNSIETYAGEPTLSFTNFRDYCNSLLRPTVIDREQCRLLTNYLMQIGIVLWFDKGNDTDKIYIDKNWTIQKIHRVLQGLSAKNGEFDLDHVREMLAGEAQHAGSIIEIMIDFKMIFKHPNIDSKFIAPLYLPSMPDQSASLFISSKKIPYRRFEYSGFIHKHVILSFFEKYSQLVIGGKAENGNGHYYWKDGLIIKDNETEEIVMIRFNIGTDEGNAFIDVTSLTSNTSTVFIDRIVETIRGINKGYEVDEMVTLDGNEFVSLNILNDNAEKGKFVFTVQRLRDKDKPVGRPEKLFKLKDYKMFIKGEIRKKKVVISYSKKDLAHLHNLRRYLLPLVQLGLIEDPWYCSLLRAADEWDNKIKSKFDEADVVIFLVSENFYATQYIIDHEIKNVIDRYDKDKSVKIVPIIAEPYDWVRAEPYNLARFSALPYMAKAVSDFHSPKLAWHTITLSIKTMIEKDLDPADTDIMSRELQEIYERQVAGKLDNNA